MRFRFLPLSYFSPFFGFAAAVDTSATRAACVPVLCVSQPAFFCFLLILFTRVHTSGRDEEQPVGQRRLLLVVTHQVPATWRCVSLAHLQVVQSSANFAARQHTIGEQYTDCFSSSLSYFGTVACAIFFTLCTLLHSPKKNKTLPCVYSRCAVSVSELRLIASC